MKKNVIMHACSHNSSEYQMLLKSTLPFQITSNKPLLAYHSKMFLIETSTMTSGKGYTAKVWESSFLPFYQRKFQRMCWSILPPTVGVDITSTLHSCHFLHQTSGLEGKVSLPALWEIWVWSLGWEESPGEENGNPLQYSWLENPTDREAW